MSEMSKTTATASRLQLAAAQLSLQGEQLADINKRIRDHALTAIDELPQHVDTTKAAARNFLAGIRAILGGNG